MLISRFYNYFITLFNDSDSSHLNLDIAFDLRVIHLVNPAKNEKKKIIANLTFLFIYTKLAI